MTAPCSPIALQVFAHRFAAAAEEMGGTLMRAAFSSNIKERRDFSCAVCDAAGNLAAQAAHIPVHLGSMPLSVLAVMQAVPLAPGDMAVCNDPFRGGTHLPDITLVAPVYAPGEAAPRFFVANRAHHADVGGMSAGSMPLSTSLFQEGIIIPPLRLVRAGEVDRSLLSLILANVRTPAEREGDFAAQIMANLAGVARLQALMQAHGPHEMTTMAAALQDYAEALCRKAIAALPDGEYLFEDLLDSDGVATVDIPIRVRLRIRGEAMEIDFRDSADQTPGSVNAVRAITLSCVLYVLRCLLPEDAPTNAGCLRPVTLLTRPGSVVDAIFPAAVAGGNVETSQRIVDVLLGALAKAAPGRFPAASQGTMNNLTLGGYDAVRKRPFAYYETLAGGHGASAVGPGASGVHSHMTNTLNTPVEALEYACPVRVRRLAVRKGSGGSGRHCGGDGLVRELEALQPMEATLLGERRTRGPWGLDGGEAGLPGRTLLRRPGQPEVALPGKVRLQLEAGDVLRLETPGGGGFGPARVSVEVGD
ncbi:MAG: hydantoinase B/oxoprolinase family protein [Desulfovibrio sp.]|nr:hydantoinase B/oxoprolinase family protein [Desulfovibrio sp.]